MTDSKKNTPPMRHCFYCGEELGRYWDKDPLDTCGKAECNREARYADQEIREEAHRQLDRDLGYDGNW
jgi:hypothetical protein